MLNQVDLNLLLVLKSLNETGSVKDTANQFHVSPSAISQSIVKLEKQVKTQLLIREHKKVRLSNKSKELLSNTNEAFNKIYEELAKIQTQNNELQGTLSIGCPNEFGSSFMLKWFKEFQRKHPQVKMKLKFGSPRTLINYLINLQVDFIIADGGPYYKDLELNYHIEPMFEEELVLCASYNFCQNINFNKFTYDHLITLPHLDYSSDGSAVGIWYQYHFKKQFKDLDIIFVSENVRALIQAVKLNMGVAMIPKYLIQKELQSQSIVEITPTKHKLMNPLLFLQHQGKIPLKLEKQFIAFLKEKPRQLS